MISKKRNKELANGAWPTPEEVAEICEIPVEKVYGWIESGEVAPKYVKIVDRETCEEIRNWN